MFIGKRLANAEDLRKVKDLTLVVCNFDVPTCSNQKCGLKKNSDTKVMIVWVILGADVFFVDLE